MENRPVSLKNNKLLGIVQSVGEKVKSRRIKKGMTLMDLADAVNCSQDCISEIESGKRNSTLEELFIIAESMGVTVGYFFK